MLGQIVGGVLACAGTCVSVGLSDIQLSADSWGLETGVY